MEHSKYISRICDKELQEALTSAGAVLIEGAKSEMPPLRGGRRGGKLLFRGLKHHGYQYAMPDGIRERISTNRLCLTAYRFERYF